MHVSAFPELSARHLLTFPAGLGVFEEFYGKPVTRFYHGRGALWRGIKLLGLGGRDKVLLPSYHCGIEVEAVRQAGVGIEFYGIKDDMTADLAMLEEKAKADCKAVLVIHYFGFSQPIELIRQICQRRNLFLIEDCAQALFSSYGGQPLGTYGDMAIFSPPKSLSLPDGGALLINNPGIKDALSTERPNSLVVWKRVVGLLIQSQEDERNKGILHPSADRIRDLCRKLVPDHLRRTYNIGNVFDVSMGYIGMSSISRRIMDSTPIERVVGRRRLNFEYLLEGIRDSDYWKVCFTYLPEGACPLFFPVRMIGALRPRIQALLAGSGAGTFVFGEQLHRDLPRGEFPEAERLSREVLCLPVHQHLDEENLDSVVRAMDSIARNPCGGGSKREVQPGRFSDLYFLRHQS